MSSMIVKKEIICIRSKDFSLLLFNRKESCVESIKREKPDLSHTLGFFWSRLNYNNIDFSIISDWNHRHSLLDYIISSFYISRFHICHIHVPIIKNHAVIIIDTTIVIRVFSSYALSMFSDTIMIRERKFWQRFFFLCSYIQEKI